MQVTTQIINGCKRRNSYYIADTQTNFYIVDNRFFTKNRPPKIAGFLLLLKAICLNNTRHLYTLMYQIKHRMSIQEVNLKVNKKRPKYLDRFIFM